MKRAWLVLALAIAGCGEQRKCADFSGLWLMSETDAECRHTYSRCWLNVEQTGDRVVVRSWAEGDDWSCEGRGVVEGNRLRFRWAAGRKGWHGWAELERVGDEVRGTYRREDANAPVQHCRGERRPEARSSLLHREEHARHDRERQDEQQHR